LAVGSAGGGLSSATVCSGYEDAKAVTTSLAEKLGFEPVNRRRLRVVLHAEVLDVFAVQRALDS
jgi:predicted dinucleotide-binding enzyme